MNNIDLIESELNQAKDVLDAFINNKENLQSIEQAALLICSGLEQGGKILSCGNGGSHCDAMHFAEELTGRYREDRKPIAALAISDPSHISCVSNDYGFKYIFSRSVEALGTENDVLLAISTSGNSVNVLKAVEKAREKRMKGNSTNGKSRRKAWSVG